jgi:superfamily II DNA or RNA helicase
VELFFALENIDFIMTFTLRSFQQDIVNQVIESANTHNNILLQAACGAGKTVLASAFIERFHNANRKTLFIVDNTTLIDQTAVKLSVPFGLIASGYPEPNYDDYSTFIAMAQTLANRPEWLDKFWHLILVDEAHTTCWYKVVLQLIERSTKWVIGLTATPYRLSSKQYFADIFQDAVISPSFAELQDLGYLAPLDYYGIDHADFSKVKIYQGDYAQKDVARIVNTDTSILAALEAYKKHGYGKRAIAFAVNVEHAIAIRDTAIKLNISAASITGTDKKEYRQEVFEQCKQGSIKLLVSCMALTKGFDLPEIEIGLLMRPSKSLAIIEQQIGRVARIANGKDRGIIIDCVGNLEVSGFPCERIHTKESILSRSPPKQAGEAPVKTCPKCERIIRAQDRNCPYCAYLFPVKEKEVIDFSGSFSQLITATMVKQDGSEQAHREFYRQLLRQEYKSTGCTSGARKKYESKKFMLYPKPLKHWALGAIFDGDRAKFGLFCGNIKRAGRMRFRGDTPHWWIKSQVDGEFGQINLEVKA